MGPTPPSYTRHQDISTGYLSVAEMCDTNKLDGDFNRIALICSAAIIVILSLLERRNNPDRCAWLRGRPALVIPVNLLDQGQDRLGVAAAFGSMASVCFQLFLNNQQETLFSQAPTWCKTLVLMLYVLKYCLWYYPIFACLSTDNVLVGSILGGAYSTCWYFHRDWQTYPTHPAESCVGALTTQRNMFLLNLKEVIECPTGNDAAFAGDNLVVQLPCMLCLFVLVIRFVVIFTRHIVRLLAARRCPLTQPLDRRKRLCQPHHVTYVRQLLAPAGPSTTEYSEIIVRPVPITFVKRFSRLLYQNDPTFKYSPKIVAITTVSIICLYQFGTLIVVASYQIQKLVPQYFMPANTSTPDGAATKRQVHLFCNVFIVSMALSFTLSVVLTLLASYQTLSNYRRSMLRMFKGQFTHLPFKRSDMPAYTVMSYSMCYAGSQIAYTLWGFSVIIVVCTLLCMIVAYVLVLPIFGKVPIELLEWFANIFAGGLVMLVLALLQRLLSAFLVHRRKSYNSDGRTITVFELALNNRKVYHNAQFFMFFFYVVVGVFGCFLTILKGIALGVVFLARLDMSSLMPGFELWDMGYAYYVSFLYVEEAHRHPVVVAFCDILQHSSTDRGDIRLQNYGSCPESTPALSHPELPPSARRARNMWFKAYTLLRNRQLIKTVDDDFDKLSDLEVMFGSKQC